MLAPSPLDLGGSAGPRMVAPPVRRTLNTDMWRGAVVGLMAIGVVVDGAASARNVIGSLPAGEILLTRADTTRSPARPDLYVTKPDGSHFRLLLRNAADAAASRDGRQIAFARDGAIWISKRDGSGARRVTWPSRGVADDQPTWSRDGRVLYFSRSNFEYGTEMASLFTIRADGRGVRQLTRPPQSGGMHDEPACHLWPSVSPDGGTIVYTAVASCGHGLGRSIAAVTTSGQRVKLSFRFPRPGTDYGFPEYVSAAWAPKRSEIAYAAVNDEDNSDWAYVSAANGNPPQQIFSWNETASDGFAEGLDSPPAWSPDGRSIALIPPTSGFLQYRKYVSVGRGDVWLITADGSSQRQLTRMGMFTAAAWLPPVGRVVVGRGVSHSIATSQSSISRLAPVSGPRSLNQRGASRSVPPRRMRPPAVEAAPHEQRDAPGRNRTSARGLGNRCSIH
jgi:Tol biopolymer transport system component